MSSAKSRSGTWQAVRDAWQLNNVTTDGGSAPSLARDIWLDVLRGFAVLGVVGTHNIICPEHLGWLTHAITFFWQRGGWVGVDVFFVLSGFLVSGLLFKEAMAGRQPSVGRFLIRRGFKIYPAFWVMLSATISARLIFNSPLSVQNIMGELLFLQNYLGRVTGIHWTLAVEEHFYLMLALWTWLVTRGSPDRRGSAFASLPWVFLMVAVLCFIFRNQAFSQPNYWSANTQTHLRVDELLLGVVLSWLWHLKGLSSLRLTFACRWCLLGLGVLMILPAFLFRFQESWLMGVPGFNLFSLGAAVLVYSGVGHFKSNRLLRWIAWVGAHSYCIYLIHDPWKRYFVLKVIDPEASYFHYVVFFTTYVIGSIAGGYVLTLLVERPCLRLRDRWFPSRTSGMKTMP
jgi:peptidoglycan/LPS O-acetylase OafA/YrhL